jgi:hypothetical protein
MHYGKIVRQQALIICKNRAGVDEIFNLLVV